jgi:hypothetical protein
MRRPTFHRIIVLGWVIAAAVGCRRYSDRDVALLGTYGGDFVLSGEGPGRYMAPVGAVYLNDESRPLSDDDFAAVVPAVRQMDPMVLLLRGRHTISDKSVPLLNQLRATEHLDLSGTQVSVVGLRGLRLKHLRALVVAPSRVSEEQVTELRRALPNVEVTRWQAPSGKQAAAK